MAEVFAHETKAAIGPELERQRRRIEQACHRFGHYRILSTLPYPKIKFWTDLVDTRLHKKNFLTRWTRRVGIPDLLIIFKLLAQAPGYDLVLVSGGERGDLLYLALAGLLPWIRTPHIIIDAHWQRATGFEYLLQRLILRLGARLTRQIQPHSVEEIETYHECFGLPRGKLRPVPWSTSMIGYDYPPVNGDYILTGGASFRDYDSFIAGVAGLPYPVEIGLPAGHGIDCLAPERLGANITIHTTLTEQEYMKKMAGCRIFAMPIQAGLERCTADRTILNAMAYRKVVVATDAIGSRAYIRDGVNGFLVPERDAEAWRATIERVYALSDAKYQAIAQQAEFDAKVHFNEEIRLCRTIEACLEVMEPETAAGPYSAETLTAIAEAATAAKAALTAAGAFDKALPAPAGSTAGVTDRDDVIHAPTTMPGQAA